MTDTMIDGVAAEYWESYLSFHPVEATSIGDRRFDDRLDDRSAEAIEAHLTALEALRSRAASIEAATLSQGAQVTQSALLAQIAGDAAELSSGVDEWMVDPLEGPQIAILGFESFQPVVTPEHGEAMVARWSSMAQWIDTFGANLRAGVRRGRVAVRAPIERTIDEVRETLARPDGDLPLLAPARVDHPEWAPEQLATFRDGLAMAVSGGVRPALARYLAVLEDEIRPQARDDDRPGVLHVPGGADAYGKLIRVHTSLDLDAADLHRTGLDEVARIDAELLELGSRLLGVGDLAAMFLRLRSDPALHFTTRQEVYDKADAALSRALETIPAWFGVLPRADCAVVRMPEHEEKHSTIAYYRQPAADGSRPGQYFINTGDPATRPRYEAEALAYHEAVPGHHLQIAIAQELAALPDFRRHLGPTAFVEGWGLYTERLSDEMGLYSSDLDRIGVLSFDAWRACRLVVDTGMHAMGWTRQQAIDFMLAHTALAANNIANEVDRYIVWPAQALAYKVGQLELLRLRAEARDRLGPGFDIKAFHDAVLGQGAVGLETLRGLVERYGPRDRTPAGA